MLDIGSYRNAISILEGNNEADSKMAPKQAPKAAPRTSQRPPTTYGSATRQERMPRPYGDHDSDGNWLPVSDGNWLPVSDGNWLPVSDGNWLPVLINGENKRHVIGRSVLSQDLDGGWTSVHHGNTSQPGRHAHSNRTREEYDDGILPLSNGVKSMTLGSQQQLQRHCHDMEAIHMNDSSNRDDNSYSNRRYQSTGNMSYAGKKQHQPHGRASDFRETNGNLFAPTQKRDEADQRSSTKVNYDGKQDPRIHRGSVGLASRTPREEQQFLTEVQKELEFQRQSWKDKIEKMSRNIQPGKTSSQMKSSYIDTSGTKPLFKAFIDLQEFPPSSVTVNVDEKSNKIIIEAGSAAKTFTQKVQMPQFADDAGMTAHMNRGGILKVEIPLIDSPQEK